jgi:hypothetical protein
LSWGTIFPGAGVKRARGGRREAFDRDESLGRRHGRGAERRCGKEVTLVRGDKRTVVELTPQQTESRLKKRAPLDDNWAKAAPDGPKIPDAYRAQLAKLHANP